MFMKNLDNVFGEFVIREFVMCVLFEEMDIIFVVFGFWLKLLSVYYCIEK